MIGRWVSESMTWLPFLLLRLKSQRVRGASHPPDFVATARLLLTRFNPYLPIWWVLIQGNEDVGSVCGLVVITTAQLHSTKDLHSLKHCSQRVRDLWWWGSLTMLPAENKVKRLSLVNHTTKANHHHHHQSRIWSYCFIFDENQEN